MLQLDISNCLFSFQFIYLGIALEFVVLSAVCSMVVCHITLYDDDPSEI